MFFMTKDSYDFEVLWSPEAADCLRQQQQERVLDPADFIADLARGMRRYPLFRLLSEVAMEVEPYDHILGYDAEEPTSDAFLDGSVPALFIAYKYLNSKQRRAMYQIDTGIYIPTKEEDGSRYVELQHESEFAHMDLAARGWRLAEPVFSELFEEWEDDVCPVAYQAAFKSGFGFVVYLAQQADILQDRQAMERELRRVSSEGYDWDAAAAQMLG